MPKYGRPKRRSSALIPIIAIAVFLYMVNRDKSKGTEARNGRAESHRLDRGGYSKGADGTFMRLKDGLEQAQLKSRTLTRQSLDLDKQIKDLDMWLQEFKGAYKNAQAGGPWPVPVRGQSYNEEQLTSKVNSLIEIRKTLVERKELTAQQIAAHEEIVNRYSREVNEFEVALARKATADEKKRLDELSIEADQWIDEKVEDIEPIDDDGILSLDEIVKRHAKTAPTTQVVSQEAMNFLKSSD